MMKRIYIIILLLYCWVSFLPAQDICSPVREGYLSMSDEKKKLTVLLSGASFASVDNGWFELGCEALRAKESTGPSEEKPLRMWRTECHVAICIPVRNWTRWMSS